MKLVASAQVWAVLAERVFKGSRVLPASQPAGTLLSVAPPVNRLNVIGMVVSPCSSHTTGVDIVRHDIAVIAELLLAAGADAILRCNLSVRELPHFSVRTDLPRSARVLRIINAADTQSQLLLERLIFLYFLQNRGWLNQDHRYLVCLSDNY
jgi:hypothetical protein